MSKYFIFIIITVMLNATSQLLLKVGISRVGQADFNSANVLKLLSGAMTNGYILLGLLTMTFSMITHIMSLSRFDVSFVFPFISFAYIIVAVWGFLFLGEPFNLTRYIGIAVIIVGTIILAMSGKK